MLCIQFERFEDIYPWMWLRAASVTYSWHPEMMKKRVLKMNVYHLHITVRRQKHCKQINVETWRKHCVLYTRKLTADICSV